MNAFNNIIQNYNLLDLEFTGPKFTWSNCQKSNFIIERLDRFLANPSWLSQFPHPLANPSWLGSMWLTHPTFDALVQNHWPSNSSNYFSSLNNLTAAIHHWNINIFGNIFKQNKQILARLKGIQLKLHIQQTSYFSSLEKNL